MHLFKKCICILITASFLFGLSGTVSTYAEGDVDNRSAQILKAIGILDDSDFSDEELSETMKRKEFLYIICKALNVADIYSDSKDGFYESLDKYLAIANSLGIISDVNDFAPDNDIRLEEAVKMAVVAMGYQLKAAQSGGYPFGYLSVAQTTGILNGLGNPLYLTRMQACDLLLNAFCADMMRVTEYGEQSQTYSIEKGYTILNKYHKIFKEKGRITATEVSGLSANDNNLQKKHVVIDGVSFYCENSKIRDFLGYEIEYFARRDDIENTLLYFEPIVKSSNVLTVSADKIMDSSTTKKLVYENENGKLLNCEISNVADLIYNGGARALDNDFYVKPDSGEVRLIDTDNNGDYDLVIVTSYVQYVVEAVNIYENIIVEKYDQPNLDFGNNSVCFSLLNDGVETDISEIKEWDVLSVAADTEIISSDGTRKIDADKSKNYIIHISQNKYYGTIDEIYEDEIRIAEQRLKISKRFKSLVKDGFVDELKLNMNFNYYLDINDEIVCTDSETVSGGITYAFLIDAKENAGIDQTLSVKLFCADGKFNIYDCSSKLVVDGFRNMSRTDVLARLYARQLISYELDSNNKIIKIDTTATDYEGDSEQSLVCNVAKQSVRFKTGGVFADKFILGLKPTIFVIPTDPKASENEYSLVDKTFFTNDSTHTVEAFNIKRAGISNLVVIYSDGSQISNITNIMVVSKNSMIYKNDETKYEIIGQVQAKDVSFMCNESDVNVVDYSTDSKLSLKDIDSGDIIRYSVGISGEATRIEKMFDYGTFSLSSAGAYNDTVRLISGIAYDVYQNAVEVAFSESDLADGSNTMSFTLGRGSVMLCNETRSGFTIRKGNASDINSYIKTKDATRTSKLFIHTRNGDVRSIVIYNK